MKGTWKTVAAGILNLISGVFLLIGGIILVSALVPPAKATPWADYAAYSMGLSGTPDTSFVTAFIVTLAMVLIIPGIISILGGICAIKRKIWGMALAGAISTFVYLPPLGLSSLVLIALSRRVFTGSQLTVNPR